MANLNQGSFVPTTSVWDVNEIYSTEVTSPEFKELLVRLYQNINNMAISLNTRDAGFYPTQEFVNGQVYFPNPANSSATAVKPTLRQVFRKVINFGALPDKTTKSIPHGLTITPAYTFTRIYGTSSDTTNFQYVPIPYATGTASNSLELWVDATYVNIDTNHDYSMYTITYIVLEYLKS